jgi:hypothetical protein
MKYIVGLLLVVLLIFLVKLMLWGKPIMDMIHDWKYFGKLPKHSNVPQAIPLECLDSGKKMSSMGCSSHSSMVLNEYQLPEPLLFA